MKILLLKTRTDSRTYLIGMRSCNKKDMLIEALLFMVLLARDAYLFNIRLTCEVSLIVDGSLVELYVNTDSTRDKV